MRKKFSILFSLILIISSIISCNNENKDNSELTDENSYNIDSLKKVKENVVKVFYSLPSPMEMASIFTKSGVVYNSEILNPTKNIPNYVTNKSLALNLGVYGADLSFSSMFNQQQKTLEYFTALKTIATKLDIIETVSDSLIDVIENNINDNEKMMKIVSETFFSSDAFLKESNREEIATLVVIGAWVESLYIAIQLSETATSDKDKLITRIIDQRLSLETLIELTKTYITNNDIATLLIDLEKLKLTFESLVIVEKKEVYDEYADIMRVKTTTTINATPELVAQLKSTVSSIRTSYIK